MPELGSVLFVLAPFRVPDRPEVHVPELSTRFQGMTNFGTPRDVKGKHLKRIWELEFPEEELNERPVNAQQQQQQAQQGQQGFYAPPGPPSPASPQQRPSPRGPPAPPQQQQFRQPPHIRPQ